jgi:hypothetical protein
MITTIATIVLIASFLGIAVIAAKALDESSSILAEIKREEEISEARYQRMKEMDAEMCNLIRSYGESRINTLKAMGEIEINRIRDNANK